MIQGRASQNRRNRPWSKGQSAQISHNKQMSVVWLFGHCARRSQLPKSHTTDRLSRFHPKRSVHLANHIAGARGTWATAVLSVTTIPKASSCRRASWSHVRRVIYWDNRTVLRKLAYAERDRSVLQRLIGPVADQRIVYILPSASSQLELQNFWQAHLFLPTGKSQHHWLSTDLSYEEVVEQLKTLRPHVVFSYGSYSEHFFRFLSDRRLSVALPRVWVYGADMLSPPMREWIEERFDCQVYSTYQATETGRLGFECERRPRSSITRR